MCVCGCKRSWKLKPFVLHVCPCRCQSAGDLVTKTCERTDTCGKSLPKDHLPCVREGIVGMEIDHCWLVNNEHNLFEVMDKISGVHKAGRAGGAGGLEPLPLPLWGPTLKCPCGPVCAIWTISWTIQNIKNLPICRVHVGHQLAGGHHPS